MAQAPSKIPQLHADQNSWAPIFIWAGIQFALWIIWFLFLFQIVPEFQKMFEEYGIELSGLAQFTIVCADRVLRIWPLALIACMCTPGLSIGLMYLVRRRKTWFRMTAIGLALIPLILLLVSGFSMALHWIFIAGQLTA